jgi:hypothetical protein
MLGDVHIGSDGTTTIQDGAVVVSNLEGLGDAEFITGTDGTTAGNKKVTISGDIVIDNTGKAELQTGVVTSAEIADNAVGNDEMQDDAIGTAELQNDAVTSDKIADNAVGNSEIADNAVTTAEIGTAGAADASKVLTTDASGDPRWETRSSFTSSSLASSHILVGNSSGVATGVAMSGDVLIDNTGKTTIQDGSVVVSNLETLGSAEFIIGTATGNSKAKITGDILVANTGDAQIQAGVVGTTELTNKAVVATKLNVADNGTSGQLLTSNGTGGFVWVDPGTIYSLIPIGDLSNVGSDAMTSGNILIADGDSWESKTLSGDISIAANGTVAIQDGAVALSNIIPLEDAEIIMGTNGTSAGNSRVKVTGDITINNTGTAQIVTGSIVNDDISSSAAIVDTKLATISTPGKIANTATSATSGNTVSTIVLRDASGNFSAGTITANLTGKATSATNISGGSGGTIPYQSGANTTAMLANGSAGQVLTSAGGTGAPVWATPNTNFWSLSGNSGTSAASNYIGTSDNVDLVFKANNIERARIESATGDMKMGDANSGTIKATKELVLREDGDQFGTSLFRLRNRNTENGAIFETQPTDPATSLVDFIFKTSLTATTSVQRNVRFEARSSMAKAGVPSFHLGGSSPDVPTLAIGDNYSAFNSKVWIGSVAALTVPVPAPTALLNLGAGEISAGSAPLKFTAGPVLTIPENGAVEYDGSDFYATTSGKQTILARIVKGYADLDFPSTGSRQSSVRYVSCVGAAIGDPVILGIPNSADEDNSTYTAWVSAVDQVCIKFNNYSAGSINPAGGRFKVSVLKY